MSSEFQWLRKLPFQIDRQTDRHLIASEALTL